MFLLIEILETNVLKGKVIDVWAVESFKSHVFEDNGWGSMDRREVEVNTMISDLSTN